MAVRLPGGVAAKIHATSGLGKVILDPRFDRIDANIYKSPEYERANDKVEIALHSGTGNVGVNTNYDQDQAPRRTS